MEGSANFPWRGTHHELSCQVLHTCLASRWLWRGFSPAAVEPFLHLRGRVCVVETNLFPGNASRMRRGLPAFRAPSY